MEKYFNIDRKHVAKMWLNKYNNVQNDVVETKYAFIYTREESIVIFLTALD